MREKGYLRSDYASRAVCWLKGFFDPGDSESESCSSSEDQDLPLVVGLQHDPAKPRIEKSLQPAHSTTCIITTQISLQQGANLGPQSWNMIRIQNPSAINFGQAKNTVVNGSTLD
jgi:hypothetical protein